MTRAARRIGIVGFVLLVACSDDANDLAMSEGSSTTTSPTGSGTTASGTTGTATSTATTSASSGEAGDVEPPELVDIRVSIDGGPLADLNGADLRRVLPDPVPAEFTVRARDDSSDDENLRIDIVDDADAVVSDAEAMFSNGLWKASALVSAGQAYRVRATDEAGNPATSTHGLVVPTPSAAAVGAWDQYLYDTESISEVNELVLSVDGTWSETQQMGSRERSGLWSIEGTTLTLVETSSSDGDTDPATEDFARISTCYLDEDYFVPHPYLAQDGQVDTVDGAWSRSWTEREPGAGGLEDAREVQELLTLQDNGDFRWQRTTTPASGPVEITSQAGTWRVELNGEYFANYGDFLVLDIDEIDDAPATPSVTWSLHRARAGRLLFEPHVTSEG